MESKIDIASSRREYDALPDSEWRKDFFSEETGGFVATSFLKLNDNTRFPGIQAEIVACRRLACMGKHVLRLPENVPDKIDRIIIDGKKYRDLLKFKNGDANTRGYPDAYFDDQTWDFKTSSFANEDSLRQSIKDGRKADNLVFITDKAENLKKIEKVIHREIGMRKNDATWNELPNVYALVQLSLLPIWIK